MGNKCALIIYTYIYYILVLNSFYCTICSNKCKTISECDIWRKKDWIHRLKKPPMWSNFEYF